MEISTISSNAVNAAYNTSTQALAKAASIAQQQQQKDQSANDAVSASKQPIIPQGADSVKINSSSVTSKNLAFVRDIEQMHVNMNRLAKGVRETNEALEQVAQQARAMQNNTFAIIKNFPPFTSESQERMQILMSYSSLGNEILKMTVPSPPPPIYEHVKHLWNSTFGKNGQLLASAVPALQTDSSDQEIKAAASALDELGRSFDGISSATAKALIGR